MQPIYMYVSTLTASATETKDHKPYEDQTAYITTDKAEFDQHCKSIQDNIDAGESQRLDKFILHNVYINSWIQAFQDR